MKTKTTKVPDSGWKCCKLGHEKFIKEFKQEVTAHYNFIKMYQGVDDVYKYTECSEKLREEGRKYFYFLNALINEAPLLEGVYTVYRMSPPFSQISLYTKQGEYITDSKTSKLEIGDIFTEKKEWVELGTTVLSATYDKNYPLADFSVGMTNDEIITMNSIKKYINLMKKDTFFFHSYFKTAKQYDKYKNDIKELYDTTRKEIKKWMKLQYPPLDDSIFFYDIKEVGERALSKTYDKLYKKIEKQHFLSKLSQIKSCCFFKIKLKNKKGLFIERVSRYPQQREILIPNGTRFKVTNISVEKYGVIDTSKVIKQVNKKYEEEKKHDDHFSMFSGGPTLIRNLTLEWFHGDQGFISDSSHLQQFKNISDNLPVKIKKIKVYEIETC